MNKYAVLDLSGLLLTGFVTDKISLSVLLFSLIFSFFEYETLKLMFQHCLFKLQFPQSLEAFLRVEVVLYFGSN